MARASNLQIPDSRDEMKVQSSDNMKAQVIGPDGLLREVARHSDSDSKIF